MREWTVSQILGRLESKTDLTPEEFFGKFSCLSKVDWKLLHEQKMALLVCLDSRRRIARHKAEVKNKALFGTKTPRVQPEDDPLEGILNLLDSLQDDAEKLGLWKFPDSEE